MSDRTLDLLADLVRLLKKYGPEEFAKLAQLLGDPTVVRNIRAALETVAKAAPERTGKPQSQQPDKADPKADPTLDLARATLMSQTAYPRLEDLADEAHRLGAHVPPAGFRSRKDAVRAITNHLCHLSPDAMTEAVKQLRVVTSRGSLEQWSDIILARKP